MLSNTLQGLFILALCGLSQASPAQLSLSSLLGSSDLDGDSSLNEGLPSYFKDMSQYAPRYNVHSSIQPSVSAPPTCSIESVSSLERHGARHLTKGASKGAKATLAKVQAVLAKANYTVDNIPARYKSLLEGQIQAETDSLVPYGALQAYLSGKSSRKIYPDLAENLFVRSTGDPESDRVIVTARYWRLGAEGKPFPSGLISDSASTRSAVADVKLDVIVSERDGQNNTLDVSTCDAEENQTPDPEDNAKDLYGNSTLVPVLQKRFSKDLKSADFTSFNTADFVNLGNLCSFETLGRATVQDGKLNLTLSSFCDVFDKSEWKLYGYTLDVGKYYGAGYGNPYYKAHGTGYIRELLARLTGERPPLDPPTSLNITLDSSNVTFPVPPSKLLYFDGTHDNNAGPVAAAIGLFDGPVLQTSAHAERNPHNWVFSQIAPLQGKLVFEKLSCKSLKSSPVDYLRIRVNGQVMEAKNSKWCQGNKDALSVFGLCPIATVEKSLEFANEADEWNKCYST